MKKKFDYFSDKYQLSHHSNNIIYNYLKWLTKDIDFRNKNVLDVGGGSGLISYFSHVNGANKVVNLEPFASGSREHKNNDSDYVEFKDISFQKFQTNDYFDIIFFHDSINHLEENKFKDAHTNEQNFDYYVKLISKINRISSKGSDVIVTDCSRLNFFQLLGIRSPFAPSIGWKYHQSTRIVKKIFMKAGLDFVNLRWSPLKRLGKLGYLISLVGSPMAYFFQSHFVLHFKTKR